MAKASRIELSRKRMTVIPSSAFSMVRLVDDIQLCSRRFPSPPQGTQIRNRSRSRAIGERQPAMMRASCNWEAYDAGVAIENIGRLRIEGVSGSAHAQGVFFALSSRFGPGASVSAFAVAFGNLSSRSLAVLANSLLPCSLMTFS